MQQVICDFCGSRNYKVITKQTDIYHHTTNEYFTVVECKSCGLTFTNPRPNESEIGKYYSAQYDFHSSKSNMKLLLLGIIEKITNSKLLNKLFYYIPFLNKKLVTYVKPNIKDPVLKYLDNTKALLDIGCGSGLSAHFWGEKGSLQNYKNYTDVYGVEISDLARKELEYKGITAFKSIDNVPEHLKFDIIRMNWSLEHVHSPRKFFEFIKAHLNKDGVAIILVPNMEGLMYKIAVDSIELPIHLYHFKYADMLNYADKNTLKVENFQTFSYPQMYRFLCKQHSGLDDIFGDISLSEAVSFQKTLSRFDKLGLGNDMLIEFKHKEV